MDFSGNHFPASAKGAGDSAGGKRDIVMICILFLLAFCLRFYDLDYPNFRWADEIAHVPAATNYWNNGQTDPDNWEHPPLRHLILYGFLQVFGDNPYGWRMRNVLFGAVGAVLTFIFALEISKSRYVALLSGLLLATDPLHINLSRYTFEEVYGSAFFLAAVVLYLGHKQRSLRFILSAFFMGCALATKWYYVPGWFLVYSLALYQNRNYRDGRTAAFITSTYLLIPLSVYILSYYPWFGRGYSFRELIEYTVNAYNSLQGYRSRWYNSDLIFLRHISAWEWFVRPVIVGMGTYMGDGRGEFILYMNNLPIWILTIPSMIGTAILAVRRKSLLLAMPTFFFCAVYMIYLFIKRPAFIYSALPLLPFAFTATAYGISELTGRFGVRLYYAALAVMLAWSLYLYPLATAKKVPVAAYNYILRHAEVKTH